MRKQLIQNLIVLGAIGLGLLCGWFPQGIISRSAEISSELFLRLLQLISLPIIFLSITSTISGMTDITEMRKIGKKIFLYTVGTTIVAATIALLLFIAINPVKAGWNPLEGSVPTEVQEGSYLSFVINVIPSNLFQAFVQNNVLGVAFLAFLIGIAILFLPNQQKEFLHTLFSSLFSTCLKITSFIIKLIPIAIWAFMTLLIRDLQNTQGEFSRLLLYLCCVVTANLLQGLIILPLFLKFKKISPFKSFRAVSPALSLAFFSKSSAATLPVTIRSLERHGVSKKISNLSLPLCSVINMNGCAAFILTTVLFVSMSHGITYSPFEFVGWIFLATLAAIGNAGVPMGCFFLTSAFLLGMKVPLYMMGIILPFYTILDMIETALNVWSDACITLVVDKELSIQEEPLKA